MMVARMQLKTAAAAVIGLQGLLLLSLLVGCESDDCVSCAATPPVAPTEVYSVSGDSRITVYWNDYPEIYSDDLTGYRVWSRFFQPGDQNDPAREFFLIGEVRLGEDYDSATGQYYFIDDEVENAVDYEYAVSAVSEHGESYLSFEFVVDTPLPMSETPLTLFDVAGVNGQLSGFDFSRAGAHGGGDGNGADGIVDPTVPGTSADVRIRFDENGVPWLETLRGDVHVQDHGTFIDGNGQLDFDGVSWAPEFGWSESGVLELITGHIYVVEIFDEPTVGDIHYAKLGMVSSDPVAESVRIIWAYQLVNGLPELSAPRTRHADWDDQRVIRL